MRGGCAALRVFSTFSWLKPDLLSLVTLAMIRSTAIVLVGVSPLQVRGTMTCTGARLAALFAMDSQLSVPRDV
jgi:hypothetical protein